MQIGELAKSCGVSLDTVRYYEKQGLLFSVGRSEGGFRLFDGNALARLRFIKRAKSLGFTLKEIQELLDIKVSPENFECGEVKQLADTKLAGINAKISELMRIKSALQHLSDQCCGGSEPATECSILDALSQNNVSEEA